MRWTWNAWITGPALLLLLACVGGCSESSGGSAPAPATDPDADNSEQADAAAEAIAVQAASVRRDAVAELYATSTTLRAEKQATVIARTAGVLRELRAEEGDDVRRDEVLAVLEDDEQRIEFERQRATFEALSRDLERSTELHRQGLMSDEEYEATKRGHDEAAQAFALAELNLSRTRIRAPFSGRILTRHVDLGASVGDGTAVFDLADLDPLYADVSVPERQVGKLAVGQTVRLSADAATDPASAEIEGRIERIAPAVDPATGTVKVTLTVRDSAGTRPGAFVRVGIVTDVHTEALVVPRSALVAEGRRWHLYAVNEDGSHVRQLEVRLGFEEGSRVEVAEVLTEGGTLDARSRVVTRGAAALSDGAAIQVMEASVGEPASSQEG